MLSKLWISTNGGCSWRKLKSFPGDVPKKLQTCSQNIMLFHGLSKPYTGSLDEIHTHTSEVFWTKYGFFKAGVLDENEDSPVYTLYLNRAIPDTSNRFLINIEQKGGSTLKSGPTDSVFFLQFSQLHQTIPPKNWLNSTLVFGGDASVGENSSCTVDEINGSNFTLNCRSGVTFDVLNEHFLQGRWYNKEYYHSNIIRTFTNTSYTIVNSSIVVLPRPILGKVDHVSFTSPFKMSKVLEFDGKHLVLESKHLDSEQLVFGGDVILQEAVLDIREFLLQPPDQCSMSFEVTGFSDVLVYLDVGDEVGHICSKDIETISFF